MKELTLNYVGKKLEANGLNIDRDAIHVAVVHVVSADKDVLFAGERISLVYGSGALVKRHPVGIGIVDPFVEGHISENDHFLMFLLPNTITGLVHHWKHPAFDNLGVSKNESEFWLRQFADRWNFDYDDMIYEAIKKGNDKWDRVVVARGVDLHSVNELGGDAELFWHHLSKLTGKEFSKEHKDSLIWSCSC